MIGTRIGSYQIVRRLGDGGTGSVYEGLNAELDRRAAIKVLRANMATNRQAVWRFFNEARAVNRISHPGVVQSSEFGKLPDGGAYFVMEYLEGETLEKRLERLKGRMRELDVVRIARQLASTLAAAHALGIVHRDLMPRNVMLVPDLEVEGGVRTKLLDFGVAKFQAPLPLPRDLLGAAGSVDQGDLEDDNLKTGSGVLLGSPEYMSPEQCRGDAKLDGQSDVYGLAVVMYQMLAGQPPFVPRSGELAVMAMHVLEMVPPLRQRAPGTTPALASLIERMLAKAPADRPTMRVVVSELGALTPSSAHPAASTEIATVVRSGRNGHTLQLERRRLLLAAGGVAALVSLVTLGLGRSCAPSPPAVVPVPPVAPVAVPPDAAVAEVKDAATASSAPDLATTPAPSTPPIPVPAEPPPPTPPPETPPSPPVRTAKRPAKKKGHPVRKRPGGKASKPERKGPMRIIN